MHSLPTLSRPPDFVTSLLFPQFDHDRFESRPFPAPFSVQTAPIPASYTDVGRRPQAVSQIASVHCEWSNAQVFRFRVMYVAYAQGSGLPATTVDKKTLKRQAGSSWTVFGALMGPGLHNLRSALNQRIVVQADIHHYS